jgi:hypothetical protein
LVAYKLNHPEHLFVSANVINSWRLQDLHTAFMSTIPVAPDYRRLQNQRLDWRLSTAPFEPPKVQYESELLPQARLPTPPPYKHCWLPMRGATLEDTAIRDGLENCSHVAKWQCAAIAHYSFFYRLEQSTILFSTQLIIDNGKSYDFGVYDLHYAEYNTWPINLFVGWGHEINSARPIGKRDEDQLSRDYPRQIGKRITCVRYRLILDCVALGGALAAHFQYAWQPGLLDVTDVLDRYKALVIEKMGPDLLSY